MVLPITVTNGALGHGTTSVTVPAGTFESTTTTVAREGTSHEPVTVNLGTFPTLPAGHEGYALTASGTLPLEVLPGEGASILAIIVRTQNGPFVVGDNIEVAVSFDKKVTVDTTGGTPHIGIQIGNETENAQYTSGTGSQLIDFRYTVQTGDTDTDGFSIDANALKLNSGTMKSGDFDAELTHDAVPTIPTATVDGIAPTLLSATVDHALVTLTFDEPVQRAAGTAGWPFEYNVDSGNFTTVCGGNSNAGTVTLTLCAAATPSEMVGLRSLPAASAGNLEDLAGNEVASLTQALDNVTSVAAPTITEIRISSDPDDDGREGNDETYRIDDIVEVTVTFDEAITVNTTTGSPQLELDIGGTPVQALYSPIHGLHEARFTYTVAEGDEDTDGIAIGANKLSANGAIITSSGKNADLTHNAQTAPGHNVDGIRPTMTNAVTSADGSRIIVTFSEAMSSSGTGYTLRKDGSGIANGPTNVDVMGNTATVQLNSPLGHGEDLVIVVTARTATDSVGNSTAEHSR